jgi:AraC family transcriptional regulator, dual regulator of chb operon
MSYILKRLKEVEFKQYFNFFHCIDALRGIRVMTPVILLWKDEVAPGDAYGFARVLEPNKLRDRLHKHRDFAEVFWVEHGKGIHVINDTRVPLATGDIVLMRPGDTHNFEPVDEVGFRIVNVSFPLSTLNYLKNRYFKRMPGFYTPKEVNPTQMQLTRSLKRWMEDSIAALAKAPRTRIELESFLLTLFHGLFYPSVDNRLETCPDWIKAACERIRDPKFFAGGIQSFVSLAGRSKEHVARETKKWLGKTPTELVNEARLDYAAQQLMEGHIQISEIALNAGFNNLTHFYRLFRVQFGTTPRIFRLRNQYGFPVEPPYPPYFKPEFVQPRVPEKKE